MYSDADLQLGSQQTVGDLGLLQKVICCRRSVRRSSHQATLPARCTAFATAAWLLPNRSAISLATKPARARRISGFSFSSSGVCACSCTNSEAFAHFTRVPMTQMDLIGLLADTGLTARAVGEVLGTSAATVAVTLQRLRNKRKGGRKERANGEEE